MKRMGTSYALGMKDNFEFALSTNKKATSTATMNLMESSILAQDAGGMLNTCKSDEKWCFQWHTGE
ncbi:hypothetical protein BVRB_5g098680 [Beta vulgaris subsp. vulgaris]|nr:hypothetical protein BVRB_5g098680 [Beta vulgaris subsp. vulgaris]